MLEILSNINEISQLFLLPNFSPEGQEVLQLTGAEAIRLHHDILLPIHLWLGLIHPESPFTKDLLSRNIVDSTRARRSIEDVMPYGVVLPPKQFILTDDFKAAVVRSYEIAQEDVSNQGINEITPIHLFKALVRQQSHISILFLTHTLFVKREDGYADVNIKSFDFFKELLGSDDPSIEYIERIISHGWRDAKEKNSTPSNIEGLN